MNELCKLAENGKCQLFMPKVAWDEAQEGNDVLRQEAAWEYFFVGLTHTPSQKRWFEKVGAIVFPNGIKSKSQENDVWNLIAAREMNYPFVTNDGASKSQPGGILGNVRALKAIGITVLRDWEAVRLVESDEEEAKGSLRTVELNPNCRQS